ncbi:class I SAM-dependent methyltransferase [Candidatus Viadribacter manganicus]|uniref:Ubiquinone biosynthesis protein UbiE n=1 Tax=Candidatus Viadribacter manganicus TaxID=1759059 RepID=A0A1B1AHB6_9PROT|nr:class I SAM-dependent methyltransferase [Candidatus Viadribacter manganicus]ANP45954.1 ubiquinone biosynthesis protein UbiE [Candidatus Viadribacter manganicus]
MPVDNARFWNRIARKYAKDPIADMEGYERTLAHTRRLLKSTDIAFEFGCGTGTSALKLAPSVVRLVASDISPEMIAIAREKAAAEACANVEFAVATPDAAPWPDASFDAAFGFNVLHLVPDRRAVLRGVHRLLKPGGLFISKTPALAEMNVFIRLLVPLMQAVGQAPYVAILSSKDYEREITENGFEIVESGKHGSANRDVRTFFVARKT